MLWPYSSLEPYSHNPHIMTSIDSAHAVSPQPQAVMSYHASNAARLPAELLRDIFRLVVNKPLNLICANKSHPLIKSALDIERDRQTISQVCMWWRSVALGEPRL